jgi:CRISPR/Cas system-associated protein Cas5 (RAMP superfamily)
MYFLEEVYDDSVVYRVRTRDDGGGTLYQRKYTVEGNTVTFDEQPVEVRKEVTYVTMRMRRTKINDNSTNQKKGETEMSEKKDSPCCEAKVDALIANKATQFTSKDREWLLTQEEAIIDKLSPVEVKSVEKQEALEVNAEEVIATFKGTLKTVEDYTALMPAEMQEQISEGVELYNEHRAKLVKSILDNTEKDLWKEDDLTAMETSQLEKVAKSIKTTDYSGMSGGRIQDNHEDGPEPLLPVGVKSN